MKKNKNVRKSFCGVIPIDKLPLRKVHRNCSFIVNTDDSSQPGSHWFAIYLPKNSPLEYFDSYGTKPTNKRILDFIKANGKRFKYNNKIIQGGNSTSCGLYALFFIYFRIKGFTIKEYQNVFTSNFENNDKIVNKFYEN